MANLSTPAIYAALITGTVGIIGVILQTILTINKGKIEGKNNFENRTKEKLERVYTPLIVIFNQTKSNEMLVNEEALKIINNYGYLLSISLFQDINDLLKFERTGFLNKSNPEYYFLKQKIIQTINKEYSILQNLHNKHFTEYIYKYGLSISRKVFNLCIKITLISILVNISIIASILIINWISKLLDDSNASFFENPILNFIFGLYIALSIITVVLLLYYLVFLKLPSKIMKKIDKKRGIFDIGEYSPVSGKFICRICDTEREFKVYEKFERCTSKEHTVKLEIKKFFIYTNSWRKI